jgi:peptide-methionine (R)-S-oxide reductase
MKTTFSLTRRTALFTGAAVGLLAAAPFARAANNEQAFASSPWRKLSDADWQKRLPTEAYQVLRHEGTEQPFTSPLLNEHRRGVFACLGCGLPLFKSDWKFDSHTGWPSFWQPIGEKAVSAAADGTMGMDRTEIECSRCGAHLGHVFTGGPKPTGLRYCMNSASLTFQK